MEPAPSDLSSQEWEDYYTATGRTYVKFTLKKVTDEYVGALIIEVLTDMCPKTSSNFLALVNGSGKHKYKGSPIHRVVKGAFIQGGDVVDGSGAGDPGFQIADESYAVKHSAPGIIGMATLGQPHTAATQFYITSKPLPWLDGRRVAFARLVGSESFRTLKQIEDVNLHNERPIADIIITESSIIIHGS